MNYTKSWLYAESVKYIKKQFSQSSLAAQERTAHKIANLMKSNTQRRKQEKNKTKTSSLFLSSLKKKEQKKQSPVGYPTGVKGAKPLKYQVSKAPVDRLYTVSLQKIVAFRKMLTAEKAVMSR